jgi:CRP-like cAMP-binding protein
MDLKMGQDLTRKTMPSVPLTRRIAGNRTVPGRLQLIARTEPARQMPTLRANRLLAAVPSPELQRIAMLSEHVEMRAGDVLYEAGCKPRHVYFPTTAIVSLVCETADGASGEVCAVGNDGVVGLELFTGGEAACNRAVVTSTGHGVRLEARHIQGDTGGTSLLMPVLLRYTLGLITQIAQIAVCNSHHSVEQRLCRRLLFSLDRLPTGELPMTHGQIADLLGVRRESVTLAAGTLQSAGVIQCSRKCIKVMDRVGLESRACECCPERMGAGVRGARKAA